jgi:hypothetical protein
LPNSLLLSRSDEEQVKLDEFSRQHFNDNKENITVEICGWLYHPYHTTRVVLEKYFQRKGAV